MNITIIKDRLSVLKKFPDTTLITFPEYADDERTSAQDLELEQLITEKRVTIFDLSGTKAIDTPWLRLLCTLTVNAMRTTHHIVAVVGANADARAGWEYLGQLKHIYEFPTIEAAIDGTRPFTQEEHLAGRLVNEESRRKLLAKHYHNALLHGVKLKDALERILNACKSDGLTNVEALVEEALKMPHPEAVMAKRQSDRLREQYGDALIHGHPYEEYLHLPMRPTDEYVDPFSG